MTDTDVAFRVSREDFAETIAWVSRSIPVRPTDASLRGALITVGDDSVTLSGFDNQVSSQATISAEVTTPGQFLVAGRVFADIAKYLPHQPLDVVVTDSNVEVTCGRSKFSLPKQNVEDYPRLPEMPEGTGALNSKDFVDAVSQVAVAAGRDDTLPMLTGMRMEFSGDTVVLAATDRFRLAVRRLAWQPAEAGLEAQLLVPAKTLSETAKSIDAHGGFDVALAWNTSSTGQPSLLGITAGDHKTTARLLDSNFPNFRQLLPATLTSTAAVTIAPLQDALRRVSLMAERKAQIRMDFSEGTLTLSASGDDSGRAEETLPVDFQGEPLTIAFNPQYLLDGLSAISGDDVMFGFTEARRPAILLPQPEGELEVNSEGQFVVPETEFTYLLMPVRIPG